MKPPNSETNALLCFAVSYGTSFLSKIQSPCLTLHECLEYSASSKPSRHTLCHKVTIISNKRKQKSKHDITTSISKIQLHLYMWKYWTKFVHALVFPPVHITSSSGGVKSSVISLTFGILFYFLFSEHYTFRYSNYIWKMGLFLLLHCRCFSFAIWTL